MIFLVMFPFTAQATSDTVPVDSVDTVDSVPTQELWAGQTELSGARHVPILGDMSYTSRARSLSVVTVTDDKRVITMRHCSVDFPKSPGVKLVMSEHGARNIPVSTYTLESKEGKWSASMWKTGWTNVDIDDDGKPGLTLIVQSFVCGGSLMIANMAKTVASDIVVTETGYTAKYRVETEQDVLDVTGMCLSLFSKSMTDEMTGDAIFVRVPKETTCDTMDWTALSAG